MFSNVFLSQGMNAQFLRLGVVILRAIVNCEEVIVSLVDVQVTVCVQRTSCCYGEQFCASRRIGELLPLIVREVAVLSDMHVYL